MEVGALYGGGCMLRSCLAAWSLQLPVLMQSAVWNRQEGWNPLSLTPDLEREPAWGLLCRREIQCV